ncbi:MAG: MFS transporter, partial [Turicibacter sp.]
MKIFTNERFLFSKYYFIYFIGAGAFYPFIALYFKNFEFSETQIGLILSTAPIVGIVGQPLWGFLNDYFKREKLLMSILYIGTIAMLTALLVSDGAFESILMFYLLVTFFICGLMPIVDRNVTNYCVESKKIKFGQIRIWGSIAWGGSSFVTGKFIGFYGIELIIYMMITFLIFSGLLFLMFPTKESVVKEEKARICLNDLKALFSSKLFLSFTGLWLLHQIAMLGCNAYFSLYLVELGGTTDHVGLATMVGIIAEVPALLYFSSHSERFGELKLVFLALALSIIRIFSYILFPSVLNLILL